MEWMIRDEGFVEQEMPMVFTNRVLSTPDGEHTITLNCASWRAYFKALNNPTKRAKFMKEFLKKKAENEEKGGTKGEDEEYECEGAEGEEEEEEEGGHGREEDEGAEAEERWEEFNGWFRTEVIEAAMATALLDKMPNGEPNRRNPDNAQAKVNWEECKCTLGHHLLLFILCSVEGISAIK